MEPLPTPRKARLDNFCSSLLNCSEDPGIPQHERGPVVHSGENRVGTGAWVRGRGFRGQLRVSLLGQVLLPFYSQSLGFKQQCWSQACRLERACWGSEASYTLGWIRFLGVYGVWGPVFLGPTVLWGPAATFPQAGGKKDERWGKVQDMWRRNVVTLKPPRTVSLLCCPSGPSIPYLFLHPHDHIIF